VKVAANIDGTHNLFDEACWVSRLRENLTSGSYGEGLETGRASAQAPRQPLTRQSSFRDLKDPMYGMGLGSVRVKRCDRRDRLVLLAAFSIVLMTLLGAAGEVLGFDRFLKANTTKKRTHSLLRQGYMWYNHIPNMPEERLRPLMREFDNMLQQHSVFKRVFGWI
jgi:hypothetical protein